MDFVRRLIVMVEHWHDHDTDPYTSFVDERSERLVELVLENAAKAVAEARTTELAHGHPEEGDFVAAMIDKLQDAGF